MNTRANFHGSDRKSIADFYNIDPNALIDFSSNVNPLGSPDSIKEEIIHNVSAIDTYPERDYSTLKKAISSYTSVQSDHLLIGNGATELMSLLFSSLRPKKSLLITPTYSEYERMLLREGSDISYFPLLANEDFHLSLNRLEKELQEKYSLLVLCNPNNPTGSILSLEELNHLLLITQNTNTFVLIDETYIEFADTSHYSALPLVHAFEHVMVLRGVSKFFACPGLRLGYAALSSPVIQKRLLAYKDPWSVHSLASIGGPFLFLDKAYQEKTRSFLLKERQKMKQGLAYCSSFYVYPSKANFFLLRYLKTDKTSKDLFEMALKKGMLIRNCDTFLGLGTNHIRFCLHKEEENKRLLTFLQSL